MEAVLLLGRNGAELHERLDGRTCWTVQGLQCLLWQLSFRGSFIIKDVLAVKVVALDAAGDYFLKLLGLYGETN